MAFRFQEQYNRVRQAQPPKTLEDAASQIAELRLALNNTHSKLQKTFKDVERSASGGSSTVVLVGGGSSSGGSSGGSGTAADNVRAGSQSVGAAGGSVVFSSALSGYSNVIVWAWLTVDDMTVFAEISGITISGFTVGAIPGGTGGTVYYIAFGH